MTIKTIKKWFTSRSLKFYFFVILFLLLIVSLAFIIDELVENQRIFGPLTFEKHLPSKYKFISPLLACDINQDSSAEFVSFENRVNNYIDMANRSGLSAEVSYYFRDLNNGPWVGVNEKRDFTPSSLLKVPIMMAIFKQAESSPDILTRKILYSQANPDLAQNIEPSVKLELGQSYTVDQLISQMIIYSDNQAKDLLDQVVNLDTLSKVYNDLGILVPSQQLEDNFMNVKEYSSLFRVLYNASYLNQENSEKALSLLSNSDYKEGLVANLPPNISVAHKFGERQLRSGSNQLHDCGIVYYPDHPYVICVMTRGNDLTNLSKVVRDISKMTFDEIKAKNI